MTLSPIDWIIVVVYVVGCLSAGLWMRRFIRGVDDFTIAGREVHVNLGIASLAATEMGLVTVMYTAQLGYEKGFAGAIIGVIMAAAFLIVGQTGFVIRPLRDAGVMTIPELFEKRFSHRVRWLAGVFVALGGLLNMGIFLRLGGDFLVHATGMPASWLESVMTALLVLVLLYTVVGGMLSVLVTDYLQFILVGLGIVTTSVMVVINIGWGNLITTLQSTWAASGGTHPHPFNPAHPSSFGWGYLIWMFIFQIAVVTTWQTTISRVLATKDSATATKMYRRVSYYFVGRFLLPGLWGVAAFVYFTQHGGLPKDLNSMTAMPRYLAAVLPIGLMGLLVASMIAAEMSTISGYMLTWATVIYNDIITPCLKKPLSNKGQLLLTRMILLGIAVFLLFFGLWYELPGDAWTFLAVTGNIYLASVFTLLIAGLYWPRANSGGAYAALILGAIGPLTFLVIEKYLPQYHIPASVAGGSSFALSFLGMLVGSLVTRAPAKTLNPQPST
ncbi:MAG: Sodium:solute symporter family protein [Verrucomicrobia bacterium]|nr:Sodium:solute symporter family protein [Verrucomicrobiota bacterium]